MKVGKRFQKTRIEGESIAMKRILSLFICAVVVVGSLLYVSCGNSPELIRDREMVVSARIVSVKYGGMTCNNPVRVTVCEIDNLSAFLDDLADLKVSSVSPPSNPTPTPTSIMIEYIDGSYEQITANGKWANNKFNGTFAVDQTQFAQLIGRYVSNAPIKLGYNYLDNEENISSVEIVELGSFNPTQPPEVKNVICEIEDIESFLNDFSKVDCFFNKSFPSNVHVNEKAIKITYSGGHCEFIGVSGQSKINTNGYYAHGGDRCFDNNQFSRLVKAYSSSADADINTSEKNEG